MLKKLGLVNVNERLKAYRPEVLHALKAIDNVRNALSAANVLESMNETAGYKVGDKLYPVDKQVKQIWRGFAFGKWNELRSEHLEWLVHKKLK